MESPHYFNPYAEVERHRNLLPHWQQPGATYFVTFRLVDSVPADRKAGWDEERDAWRAAHPKPWSEEVEKEYHRRFSVQFDRWLDEGCGECRLRQPAARTFLSDALRYSDGDRYALHVWVIIPNHVHLLFTLHVDAELEVEVGAWKSVSARRINRLLGRRGAFWQEDYFDRIVRDERHFGNCGRYILGNPEKANLRPGEYEVWEGEFAEGAGAPSPRE